MSQSIDPELDALAGELRRLVPLGDRSDRDAILFAAGRASGRASLWRWRFTSFALAGLSIVLVISLALALRPAPTVVERIIEVPITPPAQEEYRDPVTPSNTVPLTPQQKLFDAIFYHGIDGVPQPPPAGPQPPPRHSLFN